ncbi:hypothetical protein DSUL_50365 [Desulfovibrionales bacterium]
MAANYFLCTIPNQPGPQQSDNNIFWKTPHIPQNHLTFIYLAGINI